MPIMGITGPKGSLKVRGAFGRRFRRISTSQCRMIYEKIQKVHPVRIRNVSWSLVESPVTLIRIIAAATNSSPT